MKRVNTINLLPGMVTAEDVLNLNGQLVLARGTTLTDQNIAKLIMYSVFSVQIKDEFDDIDGAVAAPVDNNATYYEKVRSQEEFIKFKKVFDHQVTVLQGLINDVVKKNADPDVSTLLASALSLASEAKNTANLLEMLHTMRDYDDSTYVHSLNVALLCNIMAQWLHMTDEEIQLATLCGLLHDIGKLLVPDTLIQKPAKLSDAEYARVQQHAKNGYAILKDKRVNGHVKNAALMHHERCDGSGYPLHAENSDIDPFAKMVAIADVYDAMTSPRVYRGPLCPFTVVAVFEEEGLQRYDAEYVLTFLEHIVSSYIGTTVCLSDGREGQVVFINRDHLSKPTVMIGTEFVDLSKEKDLTVSSIK